jgi:thiol:disulfide interchange protein DsbD
MSVLASIALLIGSSASSLPSQPVERVKWAITRVTRAARGDTQFVEIGARIDPGWHVYSLTQDPAGPFPLRVTLPAPTGAASAWTIAGAVKGPAPERQPTSPFGIPVEWYSGAPQFSVPVVSTPGKGASGTAVVRVRYQACSDTLCLPPKTIELSTRLAAR